MIVVPTSFLGSGCVEFGRREGASADKVSCSWGFSMLEAQESLEIRTLQLALKH